MADPVVIVDYDPNWPALFHSLAAPVAAALGSLLLRVEHVGSTAVFGLAAKPVIDLDAVVASPADVPAAAQRLAGLGYVHRGDLGVPGREAFRGPSHLPRHHLYVCPQDSPALEAHLKFRDALRADPATAAAYAAIKRALAVRFGSDREGFTEAKTEFVQAILRGEGVRVPGG